MKGYSLHRVILALPISLGLLLVLNINLGFSEKTKERVIKPTTIVEVQKAEERTLEDMEETEARLGFSGDEEVPFMPTMEPWEYESEKAAVNAESTRSRDRSVAPESSQRPPIRIAPTLRVVNYDGINQTAACGGCFPPDTHGAVGPSHFVEVVNTRVVVYNKANPGVVLSSVALNAFFGSTEFVFDPRVVYDLTWDRWVVVATRRAASAVDPVRRFFLLYREQEIQSGLILSTVQ